MSIQEKLFPWAVVVILSSCSIPHEKTQPKPNENNDDLTDYRNTGNLHEVVIDSCEYIVFDGYRQGGICHKGNCKNHKK